MLRWALRSGPSLARLGDRNLPFVGQRSVHISAVRWLPVVNFKLSDIGEGIAEVQVKEWHIKVGDRVAQFDPLCEVQSDKASVTITSRYDGVVKKLHYAVDDVARVGQPLVDIDVEGGGGGGEPASASATETAAAKAPATCSASSAPAPESSHSSGKVLATPAVRRIAAENNLHLSDVKATGPHGRVLKEDVLRHLGQIDGSKAPESRAPAPSSPAKQATTGTVKTFSPLAADVRVPIRGYARAMAKTMTEALKIPHFGYDDEIVLDELVRVRRDLKALGAERGIKVSYMPFFIKACSLALLEFPQLNAVAEPDLENVIHKSSHNICLAMDTPGGLVVPNIKHCEQRSVLEIAAELNRLHEAGLRQKLGRDDLVDGTFTLSNIGAIGGTYASPVIFPPQVAIGAIGRVQRLPRFAGDDEEKLVAAHVAKVSWAADHRVVDGATIARFSNRWKQYLEQPVCMLANMK